MKYYKIYKLQNTSGWEDIEPTICITENDPGWKEALQNWRENKPPTDSPEWKRGVFAQTKPTKLYKFLRVCKLK